MPEHLSIKPFTLQDGDTLETVALEIFHFQVENCRVYREYTGKLGVRAVEVKSLGDIPFLPIEFFKTRVIVSADKLTPTVFMSSGTGGDRSQHYVTDISVYEKSFLKGVELFYGPPEQYCILALLPSYVEQGDSSLVYMVEHLVKKSGNPDSGFYLDTTDKLARMLIKNDKPGKKVLLFGVTYALLDFAEKFSFSLKNTIVMETGGMKGRRKEMVREEMHEILCRKFGVSEIHSEYGMTELLSQAYSKGGGRFYCPPWMKVFARDVYDPLAQVETGKTGVLNIIDLANINSCSFIATQDLGRVYEDGSFEVLGRVDNSDLRGCNLMVE